MGWWEASIQPVPRDALQSWYARWNFSTLLGLEERPLEGSSWPVAQPWEASPKGEEPTHVEVRLWFECPPPAHLHDLVPEGASVLTRKVEDEDWGASWRDGFTRLEVSPRLHIAPPWLAHTGDVIINPGVGFGTGHHPTTAAALTLLDHVADRCATSLDVGAGSGILTLAARHLNIDAMGIEIDPKAVDAANANALLNGREPNFTTTSIMHIDGTFDCVMANLHAELLIELWTDLTGRAGRWMILAGILEDRAATVLDLISPPLRVVRQECRSPWVSILVERNS